MVKAIKYFFISWMAIILFHPINASDADCPDDQIIPIISPRVEQIPLEDIKVLTLKQLIPEDYRSSFNKANLALIFTSPVLGSASLLSLVIGGLPQEFHQTSSIVCSITLGFLVVNYILENVRIEMRTTQTFETA